MRYRHAAYRYGVLEAYCGCVDVERIEPGSALPDADVERHRALEAHYKHVACRYGVLEARCKRAGVEALKYGGLEAY